MKKVGIFAVMLLLFNSCHNKEGKVQEINWEPLTVSLSNPQKIEIPQVAFECENSIQMIGNQYFFCTPSFEKGSKLNLYRLEDDTLKFLNTITQKGEGPLETAAQCRVYLRADSAIVIAAPSYNSKIFVLEKDKMSDICNISKWTSIPIPKGNVAFIDGIVPLNSSRFLITQIGDVPSMFSYFASSDTNVVSIPCVYPKVDLELQDAQKTMMYAGKSIKHPIEDKVLFYSQLGEYAYIFDLKDGKMDNKIQLKNNPPVYKLGKDGVNVNPSSSNRLSSFFYATEKYLYEKVHKFTLGMIGHETEKNDGYDGWFNNEVCVYDWNGNPVKRYKLDNYISSLVVDSNDENMYCITKDIATDDISLIKYNLKEN